MRTRDLDLTTYATLGEILLKDAKEHKLLEGLQSQAA